MAPVACPLGRAQRGLGYMRGQPLTLYEREKLQVWMKSIASLRDIGRTLGRDHSVLVRELKRNTCPDGVYRAQKAHEYALKRLRKKRRRKLDTDERLRAYVVLRLTKDDWSPEQIARQLKKRPDSWMDGKGISHETIYTFIYEGQGRFLGLYQYLRYARKSRRPRYARKSRRNQPISFITPLAFRSREAIDRSAFGHWESDTTVCEHRGAVLSVQYERSIQLCRLTKVEDKSALATEGVWRDLAEEFSVKSLTMDRGSEGAHHWKLRLDYNVETYHCDPYCSWQKGGVENLNGLIRQYLPRGVDLDSISHHQIYAIQEKLNNRPRKSLGDKSPNQRLRELRQNGVVH